MGNIYAEMEAVNDPAENPDANVYAQMEISRGESFSFNRNIAEPINRGALGILDFPATLINMASLGLNAADRWVAQNVLGNEGGTAAAPQVPTSFTELGERIGVIAPEEERRHGFVARASEFVGASFFPSAAIMNYGRQVLTSLSPVPTVLQQMGRAAASSPGKMTAFDIAANVSAAAGGEIAREFTDNETIIAMSELGSAFIPTAAMVGVKALPVGKMYDRVSGWALETIMPFTQAGGKAAAARRLQSVAADPEATAAALDLDSPVPPMQQSGDPGILKLQDIILSHNPAMRQEWSDELKLAIDFLSRSARISGGDVERAAHLLAIRQQMAVEEAAAAIARLGPNATPREISVAARRAAEASLDDATSLESAIWKSLDDGAPADIENAATALSEIIAKRSPDADPADIPEWLIAKMSSTPVDEQLMAQLQKQGYASADGVIDPAILAALEKQGLLDVRQRTLEDVRVLRGRVLQAMRDEKAVQGRGPNRNKLRILNEIQGALLDDMHATGVPGVDEARAFSNAVNTRFRKGRVGKLLGYDTTGAERVAEEDFLNDIIYGPASATNTKMFVEIANDAPQLTLDFIKAKYLESVVNESGTVSQTAHNSFVQSMKEKGMFEVFPELRAELDNVAKAGLESLKLETPRGQINTTNITKNQSRAALFLQASPGDEMALVLRSRNPAGAIKDVMATKTGRNSILAQDRSAVLGLQDSFVEEIFNMSAKEVAGVSVPQGAGMKVLLTKYRTVMRQLHMSDAQVARLEGIAENLRVAQLGISGEVNIGSTIMDSNLNKYIEYIARIIGARYGAQLGGSSGGSIQTASIASSAVRDRLRKITSTEAERLLVAAVNDGNLYRALLVGPTATETAQQKALTEINKALNRIQRAAVPVTGVAITGAEEDE